jgi:transcriptional regulator of arginine metabolism
MSSNREVQERRREMIRTILMDEETPVGDQKELVELLKARGFAATQPSVSRDLRDLGAVRIQGRYQILDWLQSDEESPVQKAKGLVLRIMTVESNQILVVTERGAGMYFDEALEASGWEDIVGTLAGYSSVLIFTQNKFFRNLVWQLLEHYLGRGREAEEKREEEPEQGSSKAEA